MEELHNFNTTFAVLKKQVVETIKASETDYTRTTVTPRTNNQTEERDMKLYRQTRSASTELYATFASRWSCSIHERHMVNICPIDDDNQTPTSHCTKFVLAMRSLDCCNNPEEIMWLDVIHTEQQERLEGFTGRGKARIDPAGNTENPKLGNVQELVPQLEHGSQRFVAELPVRNKRKLRKSGQKTVHFHPNIPIKITGMNESTPVEKPVSEPSSPEITLDLRTVDDYCLHFQKSYRQGLTQTSLQHLSECYVQKFCRSSLIQNSGDDFCPLDDFLRSSFENSLPRASILANIAMGKYLAELVLQFYSTPWLPHDWASKDIYLFGGARSFGFQSHLNKPYLALNFAKSAEDEGKGKQKRTAGPLGLVERGKSHRGNLLETAFHVRNETLFRLGIILLEIGYSKPWEVLRQDVSHHRLEYFAAEHLAIELAQELGPVYSRTIRKCLSCDFVIGETDLEDETVQRTFITQVIDCLGKIEKLMAALWE